MKLSFQKSGTSFFRYCILFLFVWIIHMPAKASTIVGCDDFVCEDFTFFESLPFILALESLTGEYCDYLSFEPDIYDQTLFITDEGITPYTIYNLITGDSCSGNIIMQCSVSCPDEYTAVIDYGTDSIVLQPADILLGSCYDDEVFLPPYEDGLFYEGEYEVALYSALLEDSCSTSLLVIPFCSAIECKSNLNRYKTDTIWPHEVIEIDCPDTSAYLLEVIDEIDQVILSGNPLELNESLPDSVQIRVTHIETGSSCTSTLYLFSHCLVNTKDSICLDFTGVQSLTFDWDSLFTEPCPDSPGPKLQLYYNPHGPIPTYEITEFPFTLSNFTQNGNFLLVDVRTNKTIFKTIQVENKSLGLIQGYVFLDTEGDCYEEWDSIMGAPGILLYAIGSSDTTYEHTFDNGLFNFRVPEFNSYEIGVVGLSEYWDICVNESPVYLGNSMETVYVGLDADTLCTYLQTDLSIPRFRRCFDNNIYIDYCNYGSDTAYDAVLDFYFDEGLEIDPDLYGFSVVSDTHYQLDLDTLYPLECGSLVVVAFVDCDLEFETELCVEIEIGPIPDCNDTEEWSGAALNVNGMCDGDSVRFTITNIGDADMTGSQDFIVIEDDIMIIQDNTNLPEGESIEIVLPANGSTYRLIADQEPFHPYTEQVSALVKECAEGSSGISTGFVNSFVLDEQAPYISIECLPVIGSYDPNDKAVVPSGAYENHVITGDERLEYTIRFENTGTDTAFNIVVTDTLDSNLDLFTFALGGSSHPVEVEYPINGVLVFEFNNIQLPDTSVNLLGAQGFVKYTIKPKTDLPLESKIFNTADIFFDFNAPIRTNVVDLQVGEYISTGLQESAILLSDFINPNPAQMYLNVNADFDQYRIIDIDGNLSMEGSHAFKIDLVALNSGIYMIQIYRKGALAGVQRFVKIED